MSTKECVCVDNTGKLIEVNEKITFHIESIPFSTSRKFKHIQCTNCGGAAGFQDKETGAKYHKEVDASAAYLKAQDMLYSSDGSLPIVPMFGNKIADSLDYTAPTNPKQWVNGHIVYNYYDHENRLRFSHSNFNIYCEEEDVLTTAVKQFIKPDSFKSIVGIKVGGLLHTRDTRQLS